MKLKTWIFAVLLVSIFWVIIPYLAIVMNGYYRLMSFDNLALKILGMLLMVADAAIFVHCTFMFKRIGKGNPIITEGMPKNLIRSGIYMFSRNPIYIGHILGIFGIALFFGKILLIAYAIMFAIMLHLAVVYLEEPYIRKSFGKAYLAYEKKVRRWI